MRLFRGRLRLEADPHGGLLNFPFLSSAIGNPSSSESFLLHLTFRSFRSIYLGREADGGSASGCVG